MQLRKLLGQLLVILHDRVLLLLLRGWYRDRPASRATCLRSILVRCLLLARFLFLDRCLGIRCNQCVLCLTVLVVDVHTRLSIELITCLRFVDRLLLLS